MDFIHFPIILFTIICVLLCKLVILQRRRPRRFPPGPMSLPVIGNMHQLGFKPYEKFMKFSKQYGPVFGFDFGCYRAIVINDYKLIRRFFNETTFSGRPNLPVFHYLNGSEGKPKGIVCTSDKVWAEQRGFVVRTLRDFGFNKSQIVENIIQEELAELIERLRNNVGKPFSTNGKFSAALLNSIWKICASDRFDHEDPVLNQMASASSLVLRNLKTSILAFFFPTLINLAPRLTGYSRLINVFEPIILTVKRTVAAHKNTLDINSNRDLIDAFLKKIQRTSDPNSSFFGPDGDENLVYCIVNLFLAGYETTSVTLSWAFLLLAVYPAVQEKLFNEISESVGITRAPTLYDRRNCPYTECVILEVLRFAVIVPLGFFHNTTEDVMIEDYLVPKDTIVVPNLYAALRDSVWGDPDVFRPERFLLADGTVNRHHEAHLVFSSGKRVCLGEALAMDELFLFIAGLFQNFKVLLNPNLPKPSLIPKTSAVLAPRYHEVILYERKAELSK